MKRDLSDLQAIRYAATRLATLKRVQAELAELPGFFGHFHGALAEAVHTLERGINYRSVLLAEQERLPRKQPARADRRAL